MGQANLTAVNAAIIEEVDPVLKDTIEKEPNTWNRFKAKKAKKTNNRNARIAFGATDNRSHVFPGSESFDFANPGNAGLKEMSVPFVRYSATVSISGDVFDQDETSDSIIDVIAYQLTNKTNVTMKVFNRFAFGDASGEIARLSASISTLTYTCNGTTNLYGTRMVDVGDEIEIRSTAGTLRQTNGVSWATVTAVDHANKTFTVDQSIGGAVTTDIVYFRNSYNNAPRGLAYHVANSGAYQGQADRTLYRGLNSVVQDLGGAYNSQSYMDLTLGNMRYKSGKKIGQGVKILWAPSQEFQYKTLGYDLKLFQTNGKFDGSFEGVTHANVEDDVDVDCPVDRIFIGDIDGAIDRYEMKAMGWVKQNGEMFFQANAASGVQHADAKLAYLTWKGNLGSHSARDISLMKSCGTTGTPLGHLA